MRDFVSEDKRQNVIGFDLLQKSGVDIDGAVREAEGVDGVVAVKMKFEVFAILPGNLRDNAVDNRVDPPHLLFIFADVPFRLKFSVKLIPEELFLFGGEKKEAFASVFRSGVAVLRRIRFDVGGKRLFVNAELLQIFIHENQKRRQNDFRLGRIQDRKFFALFDFRKLDSGSFDAGFDCGFIRNAVDRCECGGKEDDCAACSQIFFCRNSTCFNPCFPFGICFPATT